MAKRKFNVKNIQKKVGDVYINVDMSDIEEGLQKAQYALDSAVFAGTQPYMPMNAGTFIQQTAIRSASYAGSGKVCIGYGPQAEYLYNGKVMVDAGTGRGPFYIEGVGFRYRKGAKLKKTNRNLKYSRAGAESQWFEKAKAAHEKEWVRVAKDAFGKE